MFGPLVELFSCMEQMNAAVEVTAGNQLFNVVVDNDATSTTIIKYLNSCKGGRVTFVPLNRIQVLSGQQVLQSVFHVRISSDIGNAALKVSQPVCKA